MSAVARKAALVVGAVALVATGVGAVAAAGSVLAATAGTVASYATLGAAISSVAATVTAKKPRSSAGGDQTRFTANKDQGLPYVMGRTSVSGFIVHRQTHGANNLYQTFFAVLSAAGPIHGIESFKVDGVTTSFTSAGAAQGDYAGWMWLRTQLGQTPEPGALASPVGAVDGWDGGSKMSGYAGYAWTLKFDDKGKKFAGGVPEPSAVVFGVKCYHPQLDSTYPGGSGPQRLNDESTWTVTDNAFLHGLTWLIGRRQNGKRVMGVGAPIDGIDVAAYVEACNIALANGWKMGGVVYSTDEKWAALKAMLQAGGGEPTRIGARISCTINAPRVSLDTIRSSDLVGDASVAATQSRRDRINAVVPRYRSEAHGWEMVAAKQVVVPAYVTEDGGQRTKEIEFPLVQDAKVAAQLAAYEVVNAREFGAITLPLKPRWIGYKPGDCLTIDIPELNMVGQTALIINRSLDPSTGVVTLTLKSETAAKHDFALGRTANPPPTPSLQIIDPAQLLIPGVTAVWDDVRNPNGTKPEDNATLGSTIGLNTYNLDGTLFVPSGGDFDPQPIYDALAAQQAAIGTAGSQLATITAKTRDGAPNLLVGGDFRDGLTGWNTFGAGWSVVTGFPIGPFLQNSGGANGVYAWRDVSLNELASYSLSGEMDPDNADAGSLVFDWLGANGTPTGRAVEIVGDNWQRVASAALAAPTGTTGARIYAYRRASGGVIRFTRIQIQKGAATAWNADATDYAVSTRLTTETTERKGETAALAQRASYLEGRVDGTGAGSISAQIGAVQAAAASDTQAVALTVTNLRAQIRSGSPNLIPNGDFTAGLDGWTIDGAGWTWISQSRVGPFAQNSGVVGAFLRREVPAEANVGYSLSAEMDPDQFHAIWAYVEWLDANGAFLKNGLIVEGDDWTRVSSAVEIAPVGTAKARIRIGANIAGKIGRLTRIQFQEGAATRFDPSPNIIDAYARILAERNASVTRDGALSGRLDTVEAQFAGTANSTLKASIEQAANAAANANTAVATLGTTLTARIRQGAPNLLRNGDGRVGFSGVTVSGPGFYIGNDPGVGQLFQKDSAAPNEYIYWDVSVQAGRGYSVSGESGAPRTAGYIQWFTANGDFLGSTGNFVTPGWGTRNGAGPFTAPTGTTRARVVAQQVAAGAFTATRFMLQEGAWTDWRDDRDAIDSEARVTQQAGVLATIDGRTKAYWSVTAVAGNDVASVTVYADNGAGGVRAGVLLGGNVYINGNLMVSGSIQTAGIADFAVIGLYAASAPYANVELAAMQDVLVLPVQSTGKPLLITASASANVPNATPINMIVTRDGVQGSISNANGSGGASLTVSQLITLPAGSYVFRLQASAPNGPAGISFPALTIQEIKK